MFKMKTVWTSFQQGASAEEVAVCPHRNLHTQISALALLA